MRIVHFLYADGHGGDALAPLSLARGQLRLGCDVHVVLGASEHSRSFVERARAQGVGASEHAELPLTAKVSTLRRMAAFRDVIGDLRADVLHVHTNNSVGVGGSLSARLSPARRRFVTVHTYCPWPQGSESAQRRWRLSSRAFERVFCPSSLARSWQLAAGLPPERVVALPNGVDVERFDGADREKVRGELGLSPADALVLFLARVEAQKRPLAAVDAFAAVAARFPAAKMLVVGNGDLEPAVRRRVEERGLSARVVVAGYRTDVPELMRAADVYVLPTESESFCVSVVEAMAAGAPVVTSRIAPLVSEVVPEDCALFVAPGDEPGLAEALASLLASPSRREELAAKGKRVARERYSLETVARRHVDFYER